MGPLDAYPHYDYRSIAMISLNTFKRVKELYTYRHEPEYMRPLGEIVWHTLLLCAAIGAVGVLLFAASVFVDVLTTLGGSATGTSRPPVVLDRAKLDETLRLIDQKAVDFQALKSAPTAVVDPSK